MAEASSKEKEEKTNISEYLESPKKRKKNFVIIALAGCVDPRLAKVIESFVKRKYPALMVVRPKDEEEFLRYSTRKISLVIIHDQFLPIEHSMELIKGLKSERRKDVVPVLFFTEHQEDLIKTYSESLAAFQEVDDFCVYSKLNQSQILEQIKQGIDNKNRRRSRRYKVDVPSNMYSLRHDSKMDGRFIDLSVHGGLIKLSGSIDMKCDDQIKVSLPRTTEYSRQYGEFIRLSARVRRVYIGGDILAFSFENLSDEKHDELANYVLGVIKQQI